jgi:putative ABC transport system permease protein
MFKNYLKIAVRNLIRHKTYSFINIVGLAIGMASCILILLWVLEELSFDRFHEKGDRIYKVLRDYGEGLGSTTPYILGSYLPNDFPEIENITRVMKGTDPLTVKIEDSEFKETNWLFTDKEFFDIFSFPLIGIDRESALSEPFSVIITERLASKYFGEENPIGKVLNFEWCEESYDLKVTGIARDFPHNSHIQADLIISMSLIEDVWNKNTLQMLGYTLNFLEHWGANTLYTYVLLSEGVTANNLNKKLPEFVKRHNAIGGGFSLQPLNEVYLSSSNLSDDRIPQGNIHKIYLFSGIAFLILVIACFNYVILSTARLTLRIKEIGVRKVAGAKRIDLVKQILLESILTSLISLPIAFVLIELFLPTFDRLFNYHFALHYYNSFNFIAGSLLITLLVGLFSGSYIAVYLSRFNPTEILQRKVDTRTTKSLLRKTLIILQLAVFITMTFCTLVIYRQTHYLYNKDLGFNEKNLIRIDVFEDQIMRRYTSFKNELLRNPKILNVSSCLPLSDKVIITIPGAPQESRIEMPKILCDYDYANTMGMTLLEGRVFSRENSSDPDEAVILNETAVKFLGLSYPTIGKEIEINNKSRRIIGVVKDFHEASLYEKIQPRLIILMPELFTQNIYIRIAKLDEAETIAFIKDTWNRMYPDHFLNYFFVDNEIEQQYRTEQNFGRIIAYTTILSLCIAGLGLFGLALLMARTRTKEIGIRKVFGASVFGIVQLFLKEFMILIGIANILAWPVGYFIMDKWLENFAYNINIGPGIFIMCGFVALLIALITISFQTIKAATANPVEALRYE